MAVKRALEHYKKHEIVAETTPATGKWTYTVSVVSHDGDDSTVIARETLEGFESDLAALHAAKERGRHLVDQSVAGAG
ncbi:MAG: hypothetical protein MUP90_12275 [Gammaproteobacteria bacterium]|nr:hypothetical protein [Gammaproteobacteria bacterium]